MHNTKTNAPLARRVSGNAGKNTAEKIVAKPTTKSNCCCLASVLAEVNLTEYEIDTVLNAIVYLEREECHRWDCAHIAIRQAIAWLKHNGMATPAMAKWRCV